MPLFFTPSAGLDPYRQKAFALIDPHPKLSSMSSIHGQGESVCVAVDVEDRVIHQLEGLSNWKGVDADHVS